MLTLKDIVEADIEVQERKRMIEVVVYSEVVDIQDLSIEDLKEGNYYSYALESYHDRAIKSWYFELLENGKNVTFTTKELVNNLERMNNVEEFKALIEKLHDEYNRDIR